MANLRKLLLLVTLALAASVLALAQDCVDYSHFISSRSATDDLEDARRVALWGDTACAAVRGGMIYMGNDLFMSVVDAAVPSSPVVHPMQRVPASIRDIAIQGSNVWVTSYDCATLLDVSDPTLIRKKTHVLGTGAMLSGIVANDHAFFCGGDGALWSGWPACTEGVPVPDQLPAAALTLTVRPNPFNPRVSLRLTLPAAGPAEVTVHDLVGRRIAVLHRGLAPERLDLSWNGRDDHGRAVPAGVYLVHATAGGETTSHKIALIK